MTVGMRFVGRAAAVASRWQPGARYQPPKSLDGSTISAVGITSEQTHRSSPSGRNCPDDTGCVARPLQGFGGSGPAGSNFGLPSRGNLPRGNLADIGEHLLAGADHVAARAEGRRLPRAGHFGVGEPDVVDREPGTALAGQHAGRRRPPRAGHAGHDHEFVVYRRPAAVELSARKAPAAGGRLGLLHGTHALAIGIENPLAVNRRTTIPWVSFEDPPFHHSYVTKQFVGHGFRRVLIDANGVGHVLSLEAITLIGSQRWQTALPNRYDSGLRTSSPPSQWVRGCIIGWTLLISPLISIARPAVKGKPTAAGFTVSCFVAGLAKKSNAWKRKKRRGARTLSVA
jgi:hypothetical protein